MRTRRRRNIRIAVVTGTRAEYGLLRSPMTAIAAHPRLELRTIVTGMHLLRRFGLTVRMIERDGWRIDAKVRMQRGDDGPLDQANGLARGTRGIAAYLEESKTDAVLVLGDRIEALAGALAATTTARFVAHIHGGDVAPGDVDDAIRNSISRLAHIHFAASSEAAERLVRMGERRETVHLVGAPGYDELIKLRRSGRFRRQRNLALVAMHPTGRESVRERHMMTAALRAVRSHGLDALVVYPNSDRGHSGIIEAVQHAQSHANGGPDLQIERSLNREDYLRLLASARVMVGNSSSGIIEAPALGTVCVNIGPRQLGRLRAGSCVFDCEESYQSIRHALGNALEQRRSVRKNSPYGDGRAGERIAAILARTHWNRPLRQKLLAF